MFAGIAEENGCGRLGTHYETIAERALHALFVLRTSRAANVVFHPSNDPLFRQQDQGHLWFQVFLSFCGNAYDAKAVRFVFSGFAVVFATFSFLYVFLAFTILTRLECNVIE